MDTRWNGRRAIVTDWLAAVKPTGTVRRSTRCSQTHVQERAMTKTFDPHKSTNDVRQGNGRQMNSRVLFWSMGGVVIAFVLVYLIFFAFTPAPPVV
jgi:hypothetical protein